MASTDRARAALWLCCLVACLATAGFRYLTLGEGFPNDHFVYISGGWQMLQGDWPTRDWVDPGLPLMFTASAAAQALFGETLVAEAVLVSAAFGLAVALTLAAVFETTGSLTAALAAGALEVLVFPRTYGYPKVLVYALAFLCFARYLSRPGHARAAVAAAAVVVALLFRHDHGLFLGAGGALTILLADGADWRSRQRHLATFATTGMALVLPYLAYVQLHGGVARYVRAGLEFSRREAERQWHVWPRVFGDPEPLSSALVYEYYLLPVLALVALVLLRRDPRIRTFVAQVLPVAAVATVVNVSFIRDPLLTRLPDVIVPAVLQAAWLSRRAFECGSMRVTAAVAVAGTVFAASIASAGDVFGNMNRSDLAAEWDHLPRLFGSRTQELSERFSERQVPTRATLSLVPFLEYVDRCTASDTRLLVGGFLVELPFFARRRFAAGQGYLGGSFGGEAAEALALERIRAQKVPFAVLPSDYANDFDTGWPGLAGYLSLRYGELTTVVVDDDLEVRVLVDAQMASVSTDRATGWPCFVP